MRRLLVLFTLVASAACGRSGAPPRTLAGGGTVVEFDPGSGALAEDGSWVEVHYDARASVPSVSGAAAPDPFDSTVHAEPFPFRVGRSRVLAGFSEGVLGMREGARRRITLPPQAAYDESGKGRIPPGATLEYDVALEHVFRRTPSGLQYLEKRPGSGRAPSAGQRVSIRVTGGIVETGRSLLDRKKVGENYQVTLGTGEAIPALEEALPMMRKGALWRLGVAPELGFGKQGRLPLLLPGQDLLLDVELLEIHDLR